MCAQVQQKRRYAGEVKEKRGLPNGAKRTDFLIFKGQRGKF